MLERTPGFAADPKKINKAEKVAAPRKPRAPRRKSVAEAVVATPEATPAVQEETVVDDPHDGWDAEQFKKSQTPEPMSMSGKVEARIGHSFEYKVETPKKDPLIEGIDQLTEKVRAEREKVAADRQEKNAKLMEDEVRVAAMEKINDQNTRLASLERLATKEFTEYEGKKEEERQTVAFSQKVAREGRDTFRDKRQRSWLGNAAAALGKTARTMLAAFSLGSAIPAEAPKHMDGAPQPETISAPEKSTAVEQEISQWAEGYLSGTVPAEITPGEFDKLNLWDAPWTVESGKPWGSHEIARRLAGAGVIDSSMSKGEVRKIIYTYVDAFSALGKKGLMERGVRSGDFNKLEPGWQIDLSSLKNVILYSTKG